MTLSKAFLLPLAFAAGLLFAPPAAQAQVAGLTFSFLPSVQTVAVGGSADFTGQFVNLTTTSYFVTLGDYSADVLGGSPLVTGFFNGDPNALNGAFEVPAGQTVTLSGVETLSADPSLSSGTYTGTVDFQGHAAGASADTTLGTAAATLIVAAPQAVPEASTTASLGLLLALGMGGMAVAARRRSAS